MFRTANMSTAMNFGNKSFQPRAPDKGAFPLDHFGREIPKLTSSNVRSSNDNNNDDGDGLYHVYDGLELNAPLFLVLDHL